MNQINVPEIDNSAGIKLYSTSFRGTGGMIKVNAQDFKVTELLHDSVLSYYSKSKNDNHRFPLYLMQKTGVDSNHAIGEIKKLLGIRLRFLGIKDSKAISIQYCSTEQDLTIKEGKTHHTRLRLLGYTKESLRKSHLIGNEFQIVVRKMRNSNIMNFLDESASIPNFYGLQRFGSARLVTHLVGRQILKKDFAEAIRLLLCHTTNYDSKFSKEIRQKCEDSSNYRRVLKSIPRGMDIERKIIISSLNGKNHISSLRSLPINIRRLFIHAYQAYVFNQCVSTLIMNGENITSCLNEDLCFELENGLVLGKLKKFDLSMNPKKIVPATQLPGYALKKREGRFETAILRIMSDEGLYPRDFFVREMQELSVQGGFRQLPLMVSDIKYDNSKEIRFKLPIGAYATTFLRELMKPSNPIAAGF